MTCTHRIAGDGPLVCLRTDPHDRGHVYHASHGADLDQPHHHTDGSEQ